MKSIYEAKKIIYTTAPIAYDGFSTKEIETGVYETDKGKAIRKVEFKEKDFNWQMGRYASGMHLAVEQKLFNELCEFCITKIA